MKTNLLALASALVLFLPSAFPQAPTAPKPPSFNIKDYIKAPPAGIETAEQKLKYREDSTISAMLKIEDMGYYAVATNVRERGYPLPFHGFVLGVDRGDAFPFLGFDGKAGAIVRAGEDIIVLPKESIVLRDGGEHPELEKNYVNILRDIRRWSDGASKKEEIAAEQTATDEQAREQRVADANAKFAAALEKTAIETRQANEKEARERISEIGRAAAEKRREADQWWQEYQTQQQLDAIGSKLRRLQR